MIVSLWGVYDNLLWKPKTNVLTKLRRKHFRKNSCTTKTNNKS